MGTEITIDLLERHCEVPTQEEMLAEYVRRFAGQKLGTAVAEVPEPPEVRLAPESEPEREPGMAAEEPPAMAEAAEAREVFEPVTTETPPGVAEEEQASIEPVREMAAEAGLLLDGEPGDGAGEPEPSGTPTVQIDLVAAGLAPSAEEAAEAAEEGGEEAAQGAAPDVAQPATEDGKKKKRRHR